MFYLNKLCSTCAPDAAHQVSRSSALWFRRGRFFKVFTVYGAWRPSWSCDLDHLNKLSFPHPMEAPDEIWLIGQAVFEESVDDGRWWRTLTYTISLPVSLRLRWAKIQGKTGLKKEHKAIKLRTFVFVCVEVLWPSQQLLSCWASPLHVDTVPGQA